MTIYMTANAIKEALEINGIDSYSSSYDEFPLGRRIFIYVEENDKEKAENILKMMFHFKEKNGRYTKYTTHHTLILLGIDE